MSVELKYSDTTRALIFEKGAELKSLRFGGRELMWAGDPKYWGRTSPVLFPMVGSLKKGKTVINSRIYSIPKHGFCREKNFTMSQTASNEAVFTYEADQETLKMFPFLFTLKIKYQLLKNRLRINYSVKNNDKKQMIFCIGAHPAFNIPFGNKFDDDYDTFGNYKIIFEKPEDTAAVKFDLKNMCFDPRLPSKVLKGTEMLLKHADYAEDCVYFENLNSNSILITRNGKTGVSVSWTGFKGVAFWTPMPPPESQFSEIEIADFLCVEPWCGSADWYDSSGVFSEKRGIETAAPGETKKYSVVISVNE